MGLVLGVASILRLPALGESELWLDEVFTAAFVARPWTDLFGWIARLETTPPTFYGFLKLWASLAGDGDAALRLPSAIAGVAAVLVTSVLAHRVYGPRAAIYSGLLLAVAGWHVFHSREARVYAAMSLLYAAALLASHSLATRIGNPDRSKIVPALALLLASGGIAGIHYAGIVAAASAYAYGILLLAVRNHFSWRGFMWFVAAGAGCLMLIMPILLLGIGIALDPTSPASWMQQDSNNRIGQAVLTNLSGMPIGLVDTDLLRIAAGAGAGAVIAATAFSHVRYAPLSDETLALAGTIASALALFLLLEAISPIVLTRTLSFLLVPVLMLVGSAIAFLPTRIGRGIAIATFVAIQAPGIKSAMNPPWRHEWRSLAQALSAHTDTVIAGDAAFVLGLRRYASGWMQVGTVVRWPGDGEFQHHMMEWAGIANAVRPAELAARTCRHDGRMAQVVVFDRLVDVREAAMAEVATSFATAGARRTNRAIVGAYVLDSWEVPPCALLPALH